MRNEFGKPTSVEKVENTKSSYLIYGGNEGRDSDLEFEIRDGLVDRYFFQIRNIKRRKTFIRVFQIDFQESTVKKADEEKGRNAF